MINFFKNKKRQTKLTVGTKNEKTRVDWVEDTLKNIPAGSRILDAGAGEQQYKKFCAHLDYVSQDFAEYKPENLPEGLQMGSWNYGVLDIISDIAKIPEKDKSFDVIMCTEVFEHIVNPREALDEFERLLKPNGMLIITAPFCSLTHFAPYHFYTGFSRYFYEEELNKRNFEILEITPNGNYFEYIAQELNRLNSISNKYCGKELSNNVKSAIYEINAQLQELSNTDNGSSDLLCFGLHVVAKNK